MARTSFFLKARSGSRQLQVPHTWMWPKPILLAVTGGRCRPVLWQFDAMLAKLVRTSHQHVGKLGFADRTNHKKYCVKRSALAEALFGKQFDIPKTQNLHFTGQVLMYEQLDRAKSPDIMGILATPLPPPEIWSSICIYFKPHMWGKTYEPRMLVW